MSLTKDNLIEAQNALKGNLNRDGSKRKPAEPKPRPLRFDEMNRKARRSATARFKAANKKALIAGMKGKAK